jgi:hypothetical protein
VTIANLVVLALAALLAACLFTLWYVAARRRRARREAEAIAALRKETGAWDRLSHSAAGAP